MDLAILQRDSDIRPVRVEPKVKGGRRLVKDRPRRGVNVLPTVSDVHEIAPLWDRDFQSLLGRLNGFILLRHGAIVGP